MFVLVNVGYNSYIEFDVGNMPATYQKFLLESLMSATIVEGTYDAGGVAYAKAESTDNRAALSNKSVLDSAVESTDSAVDSTVLSVR